MPVIYGVYIIISKQQRGKVSIILNFSADYWDECSAIININIHKFILLTFSAI